MFESGQATDMVHQRTGTAEYQESGAGPDHVLVITRRRFLVMAVEQRNGLAPELPGNLTQVSQVVIQAQGLIHGLSGPNVLQVLDQ